ncbi:MULTISPECIES: TadE/TadG family type IV pilus assembly protein [Clostridium]|uniref:TadE-like protein n=2 Tax=Clostridium TaxID=1485 RepID=D8GP55_CLOLD|nr:MULTISPECIES: TadE family protein [Clostridium]ADK15933.1 TadE-like protein [Clostridium ljungdahlii DSM 13528]AGY75108.1 pilus assembly protein [Clostridium autoethanogenum DSM 10061]ALU35279.1 TadE family protein [Clostridium autoethanogenum DSM 10061]OAA87189.1 TadE-like protein [Clostridium ljungdahlii DSM 13528]OVY49642.1 TadE-like protein [Clostridium autoethanogenum]
MKTNQKEVVILKNLKNEKGQALVEFAIILPILLLIVMGIVQFGMVINSYITIENASREGARAGIIGSTDQEIQYLIVTTSPNLDPKNLTVTITPSESSRRSGDSLIVKVTYKYNLTVPIISSLFNNVIVLNGQTTMRVE